jgi:hypothetical protein
VGAELFHANGRTDGRLDRYDEADSRNHMNAPKIDYIKTHAILEIKERNGGYSEKNEPEWTGRHQMKGLIIQS